MFGDILRGNLTLQLGIECLYRDSMLEIHFPSLPMLLAVYIRAPFESQAEGDRSTGVGRLSQEPPSAPIWIRPRAAGSARVFPRYTCKHKPGLCHTKGSGSAVHSVPWNISCWGGSCAGMKLPVCLPASLPRLPACHVADGLANTKTMDK